MSAMSLTSLGFCDASNGKDAHGAALQPGPLEARWCELGGLTASRGLPPGLFFVRTRARVLAILGDRDGDFHAARCSTWPGHDDGGMAITTRTQRRYDHRLREHVRTHSSAKRHFSRTDPSRACPCRPRWRRRAASRHRRRSWDLLPWRNRSSRAGR